MKRRAFFYLCTCFLLTMCGKETTEPHQGQSPADAAFLDVQPGPTYQFNAQIAGHSTSALFTVTNSGLRTATDMVSDFGLSITFSYEGGYPGVDGTCGTELAPGDHCLVRVTFAPQYVSEFEQVLPFSYDDGYRTRLADYPVMRGRGY